MIYRRRPYDVEAERLTNGNWLVSHGDERRVWLPEDFDAAFEVVSAPAYICNVCGRSELVYDADAKALVCARGCVAR